ncbi:MAG: hypothetical protein ACREFR_03165, partial [Limisphaerales bacterium]
MKKTEMTTIQKPFLKLWVCLALAAITSAAFIGVAHCSFISLDDRVYVAANPPVELGLCWSSVKWAFETLHAGYWIPVTWLSHMLDCQLYGLNPGGHHVTNLIFHLANTVLLFLLLERLTARLWPSAFVALLFGIHPMHVESVAWIAERKDVLSAFFFMLTLLAYARYADCERSRDREGAISRPKSQRLVTSSPTEKTPSRWLFYVLALFFFALGLMSKPMVVTLPFVLLLLDFWPLRRLDNLRPAREQGKLPLRQTRARGWSLKLFSRFHGPLTECPVGAQDFSQGSSATSGARPPLVKARDNPAPSREAMRSMNPVSGPLKSETGTSPPTKKMPASSPQTPANPSL